MVYATLLQICKQIGYEYAIPDNVLRFSQIESNAMQFTGLLDKNGKEIYEGDICRDEDGLGVVYWEKDCWMYGFVQDDSSYKSDGYMLREMVDDCEIIGNIFENQELLK